MKATVYYLNLAVEPFYSMVNRQGWDGPIGKAYSDARYRGEYFKSAALGILEKAAEIEANDAEEVWMKLQNGATSWSDAMDIKCTSAFPRSMDVGDIVVWEDGTVEKVAMIGFEALDSDEWMGMMKRAEETKELLEIARNVA